MTNLWVQVIKFGNSTICLALLSLVTCVSTIKDDIPNCHLRKLSEPELSFMMYESVGGVGSWREREESLQTMDGRPTPLPAWHFNEPKICFAQWKMHTVCIAQWRNGNGWAANTTASATLQWAKNLPRISVMPTPHISQIQHTNINTTSLQDGMQLVSNILWQSDKEEKLIWFCVPSPTSPFVVHFPIICFLNANLRQRYAVIYHCFWSAIDLLEHEKLPLTTWSLHKNQKSTMSPIALANNEWWSLLLD